MKFNRVVLGIAHSLTCLLLAACGGGGSTAASGSTAALSLDVTPPSVSIVDVADDSTSSVVKLAGTATDDTRVVRVSWSNSLGGSGDATLAATGSSATWQVSSLPVYEGDNTITLVAVDGAGNTAQTRTTLARTTRTAPAVSTSPASTLQVTLTSAAGGTALPFSLGQGLRQGHVPAGSALESDLADFQFVVKNRWADGSAKFALLSGRADLVAATPRTVSLRVVPVSPSPLANVATADVQAAAVTASVQYGAYGSAAWTAADWGRPFQTLVSGPQMSSWSYRRAIGTDPHLVAWLELRAYRGGRVEVLPWIENGYLRVAGPTQKSGTATFTLGGTLRFSQDLTLLNHQRAVLASGTTLTHWLGGDPQVKPRHDTAYLMTTRLVPNYRGSTPATSGIFARLPTSYTPAMQASYPEAMGSGGYDPSIGLLPEWDAYYFTTGGDPRALLSVLINGYAAGRYGTHFRDESTNRPPRFSDHPSLVLDGSSGISATGGSSTNTYTPVASGASPPFFTTSHHPAMGYTPYLLTGWNYFLEETQLLAVANFLKQTDSIRQTTKGILESRAGANTTRGAAWAIRTLAQAAALTPDLDPLHAEFVGSLGANVSYYHQAYVATPNNPLGLVAPYSNYNSGDPWTSSVWMDDFFTAAFGYLKDMEAYPPAVQAELDAFVAWKYRSVVGRLGGSGNASWSFRYGAQYTVPYAPTASANWVTGAGPWYASWGDAARAASIPAVGEFGEPLESGYPTEPTSYWGNLMPALSYAVDHGAAGAVLAWQRVTSASNFAAQVAGYDSSPVWGMMPRTSVAAAVVVTPSTGAGTSSASVAAPSPAGVAVVPAASAAPIVAAAPVSMPATSGPAPAAIAALQPGQWLELPNTRIRSVLPTAVQAGYAAAIVQAWNGGTVDSARSRLLVWGGGHSDYFGNEMYALDLPTLTIQRIVEPSPRTSEATCTSALPDGTPTSRHTYDGLTYIAHADRFFSVNGSKAPCGYIDPATWTYDFGTGLWQMVLAQSGPASPGTMAVYDASTKQVFVKDQDAFFAYSLELNTYRKLSSPFVDYHLSAAIDTKRRKFVMIGNGVQVIDLATNAMTTMQTINAPPFVASQQAPGIAYDPVADRIVAWHGGSEVYALNLDTGVWTQVATGAGPTSVAPVQGTFGRWGYIPKYGVFALINSIDENAWVFRLSR